MSSPTTTHKPRKKATDSGISQGDQRSAIGSLSRFHHYTNHDGRDSDEYRERHGCGPSRSFGKQRFERREDDDEDADLAHRLADKAPDPDPAESKHQHTQSERRADLDSTVNEL